jgi:hypothetical protein
MVARKILKKPNKGQFQPGNKLSIGRPNGQRITQRVISKEWFHALMEMDPQTQMTMARRLIRKACQDGLLNGKLAIQVLQEGTNRVEGQAVMPILAAIQQEQAPQITRDMSPNEAARV